MEPGFEGDLSWDFDEIIGNPDKKSGSENSDPSMRFSRRFTTDIKPFKQNTDQKPTIKKGKTTVTVNQPTIKFEQLPEIYLTKAHTIDEQLREALDVFTSQTLEGAQSSTNSLKRSGTLLDVQNELIMLHEQTSSLIRVNPAKCTIKGY